MNRSKSSRAGKGRRRGRVELIVLGTIAVTLVIVAIVGPHVVPHNPYATDSSLAYLPPSWEYPFGTDNLGRCMFCRIVTGFQTSFISAIWVVAASFLIGTTLGIAAGYLGGVADRIVMWLITSFQVFPSFLLAVVIAGFLGSGLTNACIALVVVYWTTFARMARSLARSIKEQSFIPAARMAGCTTTKTMVRHVLPNIAPTLLVIATGDIGSVILSMSGLSYLGLGTLRPTADWGVMLADMQSQLLTAPQLMICPGICLSLVVLLFTLLGDRLRDLCDEDATANTRRSLAARLWGYAARRKDADNP